MGIRASLLDKLQVFKDFRSGDVHVDLGQIRGATGLVTTATPADNVWAYKVSSNIHSLVSNTADSNTKTANGTFRYRVPDTFRPGQTVTVDIVVKLTSVTGTGVANNGSDIDVLCFRQAAAGFSVGADLCTTAAQTFAALDTVYTKSFTITGVRAGDVLNINVVGRAIENDVGNGTLQVEVGSITLAIGEPTQ